MQTDPANHKECKTRDPAETCVFLLHNVLRALRFLLVLTNGPFGGVPKHPSGFNSAVQFLIRKTDPANHQHNTWWQVARYAVALYHWGDEDVLHNHEQHFSQPKLMALS